jgi:uncharacterized protein
MTALAALAAFFVLLCGVAVGATSIGGIMVVPVLTGLAGVSPTQAVAAASLGFLFPAVAAFGSSSPRPGGQRVLYAAALCGAAAGALTLAWMPPGAVRTTVGVLAVVSGAYTLLGRSRSLPLEIGGVGRAVLGLGVGCASAWSGTGGPVVLLPLLAWLGWSAVDAVDAAQRIQLPVALAASIVNYGAGRLDLALGLGLGVLVLCGWFIGRWLGRRLPVRSLQQLVALALIGVGLSYL